MWPKIIIGVQEIKDLTPSISTAVTEAEFIGVRLGVAFGLRLLEVCGYAEIQLAAETELKDRLDAAMDRGESPRSRPGAIVGWFNGLYNVMRLLPKEKADKAIIEELKEFFPLDSLSRL